MRLIHCSQYLFMRLESVIGDLRIGSALFIQRLELLVLFLAPIDQERREHVEVQVVVLLTQLIEHRYEDVESSLRRRSVNEIDDIPGLIFELHLRRDDSTLNYHTLTVVWYT